MSSPRDPRPIVVRGTEIVSTDPRQQYRQKIARVTVDSMVQFVGLLDASGTVLEQRNHELSVAVPRTGLTVDGDPMRLGQVVSNLLTNAAKYTPAGGKITVRATAAGDEVVLSVVDTGIGISRELLPHVFGLFVQETHAVDRAHGGLGIGLTIVRNLVERHGGTATASSDGAGKGSAFIIRLPQASVPAATFSEPATA